MPAIFALADDALACLVAARPIDRLRGTSQLRQYLRISVPQLPIRNINPPAMPGRC
jgi:hypothetical protein